MKKGLICLLFCVFMCSAAQAETIYFRNGRVLQGEIIRQTPIYIRIKPQYGVVEREFLLENIQRIVKDGEVTYKREVFEEFVEFKDGTLEELPDDVRRAAEAMAVSLIEEAMRKVEIPTMDEAPDSVKTVAQQKANELLKNAVMGSQEPTPAVKYAATEIATALIEESVKNVVMMPSLSQAPNNIQLAARAKATALIDEALRTEATDSLTRYAPEVKLAAKQKAGALIEKAMQDLEVPEAPRTPSRSLDPNVIDALMEEAVQKRVEESAVTADKQEALNFSTVLDIEDEKEVFIDGQEIIQEESEEAEEDAEEFVPELEVFDEKVENVREREEPPLFTEEEMQMDADQMVSAEVQKSIAAEQAKMEQLREDTKVSPKDLIMGLGVKDLLILGLIVVLLFVLFTQRRQGGRSASINMHDVAVSSSLTYQNLPDELKGRITSSDVTVILKHQAAFQEQVGLSDASKNKKTVIMDDSQMMEYIFENAKKEGHTYRREDIAKVLEAQEKAMDEGSSSKA